MPITATNLTTNASQGTQSSYVTASITPTGNSLQLAWVYSEATSVNTPTLSGCGVTWVQVNSVLLGSDKRLTLFRGMVASPSSGAVTIDFAGQSQSSCYWAITEYAGVNTGGANGDAAVLQSATNSNAGSTSLVVTLGGFQSANNGTAGGFVVRSGDTIVAGSGYTILGQVVPFYAIASEWRADNDTSVDISWASGGSAVGIAAEIAATTAAPSIPGGQVIARVQSMGRIATRPQGIVM